VQYHARVSRLFRISKNCFFPKPKVGSCFVRLEFLDMPSVEVEDEEMMFAIIRKAFSQRRKKILNPLSDDGFMGICRDSWSGILNAAGIDPGLRAEDISLKEYAGISDEAGRAVKEPLRRGLTLRSGGL
jgi:16S rRNA (adenine1518-N6/adenine1519-N6)-dimethyltransferase